MRWDRSVTEAQKTLTAPVCPPTPKKKIESRIPGKLPVDSTLDGFYMNLNYLRRLESHRAIYRLEYPDGPVSIFIQDDSVKGNYANNDGGEFGVEEWKRLDQMRNSKTSLYARLDDSTIFLWDRMTKSAGAYLNMKFYGPNLRHIRDVYSSVVFDGTYVCENPYPCADTVGFHYFHSMDRLFLQELSLPEGCEDVLDNHCPLYKTDVGEIKFELRKL